MPQVHHVTTHSAPLIDSNAHHLVGKDTASVQPEVIIRTEKVDDELPHTMSKVLDVVRDVVGVSNLPRPPSKSKTLVKINQSMHK